MAYSLTYPVGVLGMILAVISDPAGVEGGLRRRSAPLPEYSSANEPIHSRTICVTHASEQSDGRTDPPHHHWNVVFGRIRRDGQMALVTGQTVLRPGDLVTLIGTR